MSDESGMAPMGSERRRQFEEEIAAVRIKTGRAEAEARFTVLGVVGLALGAVICFLAYFQSTGQGDTHDVISSVILALFGLSVTVIGAALFLRYSVARFLRFWLLRLIYEQRTSNQQRCGAAGRRPLSKQRCGAERSSSTRSPDRRSRRSGAERMSQNTAVVLEGGEAVPVHPHAEEDLLGVLAVLGGGAQLGGDLVELHR